MMSNRVVSKDRSGAYDDVIVVKKEVFAMQESPCYETVENVVKKNKGRSSVNDHSSNIRKRLMCTLVIIITICILISMCVCLVFAFMEISRLKSEMIHIQQMISPGNETAFNEISLTSDLFKEKIKNIEKELLQHNSSHILELDQLKQSIKNKTQQLNSSINMLHHLLNHEDQQQNSSINTFHHQLSREIENESQQLNSSINMLHHQLSQEIENKSQKLNSSISMLHHQLSREIERESQQLNSSISMLHHQLSQEIERESQQLISSINMFHHQLSREIENKSQHLNSSIYTFNSQLNQKYLALESNAQLQISLLWNTGEYQSYPAFSCAAVLLYDPSSLSGYYMVKSSNGHGVYVYCDMTRSCGNITGGWMRIGKLDMTKSSTQCPSGLWQRNDSNIRTCTRNSNSSGCSSVTLYTSNIHYSRVCGKIKAYQFGSTDAFGTGTNNIDTHYVDGVGLTHGSPRQHIWTFAAAQDETVTYPNWNCPCTNINTANSATPPPSFVGNDYFCDTGSSSRYAYIFYSGDPLWDGAGCGPQSTCCSFNNPPWFYKQLPQPTTDNIEMRVCRSDSVRHEDISIEAFDIYIQ